MLLSAPCLFSKLRVCRLTLLQDLVQPCRSAWWSRKCSSAGLRPRKAKAVPISSVQRPLWIRTWRFPLFLMFVSRACRQSSARNGLAMEFLFIAWRTWVQQSWLPNWPKMASSHNGLARLVPIAHLRAWAVWSSSLKSKSGYIAVHERVIIEQKYFPIGVNFQLFALRMCKNTCLK